MKTKALQKKLSFQKHTVANLNGGDMQNLQGGRPDPTIYSIESICPCATDKTSCLTICDETYQLVCYSYIGYPITC